MRCSLYIHLPFCRSKCRYCDFYSITDHESIIDAYVDALHREWELRTESQSVELTSVYIGGGTPSVLSLVQWETLRTSFLDRLPLDDNAEWSVECNPDSFTEEKALVLADMGVNRLTFGIQSLNDRELAVMGRPHSAEEALAVLAMPVLSRFRSVGVDVIYGLPGQTSESFGATLRRLLEQPVIKHLSAYELTLAPETPFGRHRSLLPLPDEDELERIVGVLSTESAVLGFEQYEVSNFARNGFASRHNTGYWDHEPYLGIGCAAHSYLPPVRNWNISDCQEYIRLLGKGQLPIERSETLSAEMVAREMLFLGLRRTAGIDEQRFMEKTGIPFTARVSQVHLEKFRAGGLLEHSGYCWKPTKKGLFFADYMARELF